jgi:hypothetical protein
MPALSAPSSARVRLVFAGCSYRLFVAVVALVVRAKPRRLLEAELVALRHQVAVRRRTAGRPELRDADRSVLAGIGRLLPRRPGPGSSSPPYGRSSAPRYRSLRDEHANRRVHLAGVTRSLYGGWCTQAVRNLSMTIDLDRFRFLIRGNVGHVLVWRLDRLSRNLGDLILLADTFGQAGVSMHSFTEKLDLSSATGRMFYNILGSFAQF